MVANSREQMSKFLYVVSDLVKTEYINVMLLDDMNTSRLKTHAHQVEEDKLKEITKGQEGNNNRARFTVPAAPVGRPTQQGVSSGIGGSQRQNRLYARQDQEDSLDVVTGNSEARKVCGPTLLKDIWKLPLGKIVDVSFNSHNQAIRKEGRKLSSFLGIIARTPKLTPLHVDDWRNFDIEENKKLLNFVRKKFSIPKCGKASTLKSLEKKWKNYKCQLKGDHIPKYKTKDALLKNRPSRISRDQWSDLASYWLSDKAKRRTQANRNNRTKQKMSRTGGSKSIATLINEQDMINEKMSNSEGSTDQPTHHVAWKGDVYFQVLGNERSGYVRSLGLGPTPSAL
ncbi:uncharacterized protein LOC125809506 [Solanum verrucosum]|uniref:uncharacterized protein LOC125809506 n=1 Tax=Solanum verrucosum TaxID=315347 RepID=UPI0020D173D1|nr:uncharacterized protein LOC125809506 [Solanum verrucosum]